MRRLYLIPVMLAAATCVAVIPAIGASTKPPPVAITAIVGNSTGSLGAFCEFGVVVTYSGHAKHGDEVSWTIVHADGSKALPPTGSQALGPSPFTPRGIAVGQAPPNLLSGGFRFDVQLIANGSVVSEHLTGTFTLSGLPAPSGCPPVGQLATYP